MFRIDRAAADVDGRGMNFGDVEKIEGYAGADDIGNGIDCAHFVKVNFFDSDAMNSGLCVAQTTKHFGGVLFCPI